MMMKGETKQKEEESKLVLGAELTTTGAHAELILNSPNRCTAAVALWSRQSVQ